MIEDIVQDSNYRTLNALMAKFGHVVPDFVKEASVSALVPSSQEDYVHMADKMNRRYPCHTKEATYVSYLYFLSQRPQYPESLRRAVEDRFAKYAAIWNIRLELDQARKVADALQKPAEYDDDDFLLVLSVKDADGRTRKVRKVPLTSTVEVRKAAEWFVSNIDRLRERFSFSRRCQMADRILEKAAQYGAAIGEYEGFLNMCAGRGTSAPVHIAEQISRRVKVAQVDTQLRRHMEKTAQLFSKASPFSLDVQTRKQSAEALDRFDHFYKMRASYGDFIEPPERVFFGVDIQKLGELKSATCVLPTGSVYLASDFDQLRAHDIREYFGDQLADEVAEGMLVDGQKLASIAPTLPLPQAELLESLCRQYGIEPVYRNGDMQEGLREDDWRRAAGSSAT